MPASSTILYYIHDPMCSWCWGYRPTLLLLRENLPEEVSWQNVLGGLAPDTDEIMPEHDRQKVHGHWRQVQSTVGSEFNFDFWTKCQPRRDTYKACRVVIAAAQQDAEEIMIEAIQRAFYLRAKNPADPETLADLAAEQGLDRALFVKDSGSVETANEFQRQLLLRTHLNVWSFPSLVLQHRSRLIPITHDYQGYESTLEQIRACIAHGI